MVSYRALFSVMAATLAIEAGIFYGLFGLGANEDLVVAVEMIWLVVSVILGLIVMEHFEPHRNRHPADSDRPPN
jgi:hypothetical protein